MGCWQMWHGACLARWLSLSLRHVLPDLPFATCAPSIPSVTRYAVWINPHD